MNKKTLILGDIHGRTCWKDIIDKEQPDRTIFLGDYVTTHEKISPAQQLEQLSQILELKENNPDKFILLRGNHDLDMCGYYWAECHPHEPQVYRVMSNPEYRERFLRLTQWMHVEPVKNRMTIFVHAGVTNEWLEQILKMDTFDPEAINLMEPDERFGFTGGRFDCYGTDPQQSCTWIRPQTLSEHNIAGFDQVVGHTGTCHDCAKVGMKEGCELWLCDALAQQAYLVIEDNQYIPKRL